MGTDWNRGDAGGEVASCVRNMVKLQCKKCSVPMSYPIVISFDGDGLEQRRRWRRDGILCDDDDLFSLRMIT
jgi:hypothetical protein